MASNTALVSVDPMDAALTLNEFFARSIGGDEVSFVTECKVLVEAAQTEKLIAKYLEHSDEIFALDNEKEVQGCFQSIISILFLLREGVDSVLIIKNILKSISSKADSKSKLRLQVLLSIFNLASDAQSKFDAVTEILQYSISSGQSQLVCGMHTSIDTWVQQWHLNTEQQRCLFEKVAHVTAANAAVSVGYWVRYFNSFTKDAELPVEAVSAALNVITLVLKLPISNFAERIGVLKCLASHHTNNALKSSLALLQIVVSSTNSNDLQAYYADASNKAYVQSAGINWDELVHMQQLLRICTLATSAKSSAVSYADVASALGVAVDEVEFWVVEAISNGLIDATMNQVASSIVITRFLHRGVSMDQWQALQQKLSHIRSQFVAARTQIVSMKQTQSQGGPAW